MLRYWICIKLVKVNEVVEDKEEEDTSIFMNNLLSTFHILKYAKSINVKKFAYASSVSVYGKREYSPIDEEHPRNPQTPYGLSKYSRF